MSSAIGHRPATPKSGAWRGVFSHTRLERLTVAAILLIATAGMLVTAPVNGDFWWQDAPRHALNGAFVLDFISDLPWRDPFAWAVNYYIRYPALTILFYPPLFYVVEAGVYAILGVSHFAAQCAVTPFVLLLGAASYRLARFWLPRWSALGVALLTMGGPETALWGRQVMLDVPLQATLVATVLCFVEYLGSGRPAWLYGAAALFVAALYVKLTAVFIAPALLLTLFVAQGRSALYGRRLILTAIVSLAAATPAILLAWRFGSVNMANVTRPLGVELPFSDPRVWTFYARAIPAQLGIVPAMLALPGAWFLLWRPGSKAETSLSAQTMGGPKADRAADAELATAPDAAPAPAVDHAQDAGVPAQAIASPAGPTTLDYPRLGRERIMPEGTLAGGSVWGPTLLLSWFASGYLFFSAIALREPRHDLGILFPVALCAAMGLHALLPRFTAQMSTLALGGLTLGYSLWFLPVPTVQGYREIADYVAANLPRNGIVLFSGYRDGNFVFDIRTHGERRDIRIVRADKLFLRMAVSRAWGVQQTDQDQQEIAAMLRRDGITMVVAQNGFWDDLRQMHRLSDVIHSPDFHEVAQFGVHGILSSSDGSAPSNVTIFVPTYPVSPPQGETEIDMPFIGTRFHGSATPPPAGN